MKRAYMVMWTVTSLFAGGQDTRIEQQTLGNADIVLTIGNEKITRVECERLLKIVGMPTEDSVAPEQMRVFIDRIVQIKTLAQAAERNRRDSDPAARAEVLFPRSTGAGRY